MGMYVAIRLPSNTPHIWSSHLAEPAEPSLARCKAPGLCRPVSLLSSLSLQPQDQHSRMEALQLNLPSPAALALLGLLWIEAQHTEESLSTKWCVKNTSGVLGHELLFFFKHEEYATLRRSTFTVTAVRLTCSQHPLDTV